MNPSTPPRPKAAHRTAPSKGAGWVWTQSVLMLAVVGLGPVGAGSWHNPKLVTLGAVLFLLSGVLGLAGVVHIGRNRTPFPRPRQGSVLVQHGVYAWVRHPLYVSVIGASLGWSLLFQSAAALGFSLLLAPLFNAKARREEQWLREAFPGYADYARRVKRFIPGLY